MNKSLKTLFKILKWICILIFLDIVFNIIIFAINLYEYDQKDSLPKLRAHQQMREDNMIKNKEWIGEYEFIEQALDGNIIKYSIKIYEDSWSDTYADILITQENNNIMQIVADANIENDTVTFIFYGYLQDIANTSFKDEEILLSLKKMDYELLTYWGAIKPQLDENSVDGQVYFKKIGD